MQQTKQTLVGAFQHGYDEWAKSECPRPSRRGRTARTGTSPRGPSAKTMVHPYTTDAYVTHVICGCTCRYTSYNVRIEVYDVRLRLIAGNPRKRAQIPAPVSTGRMPTGEAAVLVGRADELLHVRGDVGSALPRRVGAVEASALRQSASPSPLWILEPAHGGSGAIERRRFASRDADRGTRRSTLRGSRPGARGNAGLVEASRPSVRSAAWPGLAGSLAYLAGLAGRRFSTVQKSCSRVRPISEVKVGNSRARPKQLLMSTGWISPPDRGKSPLPDPGSRGVRMLTARIGSAAPAAVAAMAAAHGPPSP